MPVCVSQFICLSSFLRFTLCVFACVCVCLCVFVCVCVRAGVKRSCVWLHVFMEASGVNWERHWLIHEAYNLHFNVSETIHAPTILGHSLVPLRPLHNRPVVLVPQLAVVLFHYGCKHSIMNKNTSLWL